MLAQAFGLGEFAENVPGLFAIEHRDYDIPPGLSAEVSHGQRSDRIQRPESGRVVRLGGASAGGARVRYARQEATRSRAGLHRQRREIAIFPQPGIAPDGKVENRNRVFQFPRGARDDDYGLSVFRTKNQERRPAATRPPPHFSGSPCIGNGTRFQDHPSIGLRHEGPSHDGGRVYPGAPHGMCTTLADQVNSDLFAFLKESLGREGARAKSTP